MLLRSNNRLDDIIVELLGKRGALTAQQLLTEINKTFGNYSLQGVYHELRKLQSIGVVLKEKKQFHLSINWSSELMLFVDVCSLR